jgi:hypothetical protein
LKIGDIFNVSEGFTEYGENFDVKMGFGLVGDLAKQIGLCILNIHTDI